MFLFSKRFTKLISKLDVFRAMLISDESVSMIRLKKSLATQRQKIRFIYDINREKVSPIQMSLHSIPEGNNPYFKKFQKINQWDANKTF